MIESHLHAGNQSIKAASALQYGVSITDACVDWPETEAMLQHLYDQMAIRYRQPA
jgi:3-deoxy-7-phosphoheptulonate synthase